MAQGKVLKHTFYIKDSWHPFKTIKVATASALLAHCGNLEVCLSGSSEEDPFVRAPLIDLVVQDLQPMTIELKFRNNLLVYNYTTSNKKKASKEMPGHYVFTFDRDDESRSVELYGKDGDKWYPIMIRVAKQDDLV